MRRKLIAEGRSGSTISVTGSPLFDAYDQRLPEAAREKETVLFVHQHLSDPRAEYDLCTTVMRTCADALGCRLIVRLHPRGSMTPQDVREAARSVSKHPERIVVGDGPDAATYVSRASVLLTMYSTVAYRGLLEGVPLVLADWVDSPYRLDAERYGAAASVKEVRQLEPCLREVLWNEERRKSLYAGGAAMIRDHLFRLDGKAATRVAELATTLLASS
jgi:hypothetical protein